MPSLTGSHADSEKLNDLRLSYHRFDVHRSSFSRWYAAWTWTPRQNSTGMYYTVYLWCMQYTITLPSLQWITVLWQIIWMPLSRKTGTYDIYDILVPIFFERIPGEKKMAVTILLVYYCPHNWESLSSWTQISRAHQARLGFTSSLAPCSTVTLRVKCCGTHWHWHALPVCLASRNFCHWQDPVVLLISGFTVKLRVSQLLVWDTRGHCRMFLNAGGKNCKWKSYLSFEDRRIFLYKKMWRPTQSDDCSKKKFVLKNLNKWRYIASAFSKIFTELTRIRLRIYCIQCASSLP